MRGIWSQNINSADQVRKYANLKKCDFKGPINEINVNQKFWAWIGNSVASESEMFKA